MTSEILIEHVQQAISKAEAHCSWIDESILSLGGFSTGEMRRLFSNLVHLPKADPAYLECGLFKGGTFCAAMNNSPTLNVYGVENFSQDFSQPDVREELERNIATYRSGARSVTVFDCDCFKLDLSLIKHPIDVLFVDVEHSFESQRDAIIYFEPVLSDVAVIVVDDTDWLSVAAGTAAGFKAMDHKIRIEHQRNLTEGKPDAPKWHNGVSILVVSRI